VEGEHQGHSGAQAARAPPCPGRKLLNSIASLLAEDDLFVDVASHKVRKHSPAQEGTATYRHSP